IAHRRGVDRFQEIQLARCHGRHALSPKVRFRHQYSCQYRFSAFLQVPGYTHYTPAVNLQSFSEASMLSTQPLAKKYGRNDGGPECDVQTRLRQLRTLGMWLRALLFVTIFVPSAPVQAFSPDAHRSGVADVFLSLGYSDAALEALVRANAAVDAPRE